jgi:hypothetical protein
MNQIDLREFKKSCLEEDVDIIVQRNLIEGSSYFFDVIANDAKEEFEFKKELSLSLDVHLRDIAIVGSGKLGFSIKPDEQNPSFYPFKKFDFDFDKDKNKDKSDIDVAIVSSTLFDKQLVGIYNHTKSYSVRYEEKKSFAYYILKGWFRPDLIPEGYEISSLINKAQEKYKNKYGRHVNIGIYKSWYFFENYHKNNINTIKLNLIANS